MKNTQAELSSQGNNAIANAVKLLGGFTVTAHVCGVSYQAVKKWVAKGRLPRTEATGETQYAVKMAEADQRISAKSLLMTLYESSNRP